MAVLNASSNTECGFYGGNLKIVLYMVINTQWESGNKRMKPLHEMACSMHGNLN